MTLTTFPTSIGQDANLRPSDREPSTLLLDRNMHGCFLNLNVLSRADNEIFL